MRLASGRGKTEQRCVRRTATLQPQYDQKSLFGLRQVIYHLVSRSAKIRTLPCPCSFEHALLPRAASLCFYLRKGCSSGHLISERAFISQLNSIFFGLCIARADLHQALRRVRSQASRTWGHKASDHALACDPVVLGKERAQPSTMGASAETGLRTRCVALLRRREQAGSPVCSCLLCVLRRWAQGR